MQVKRQAQGFIYVLHFDDPIAHAQHYVGCTKNPLYRFKKHSIGQGSRLCKELFKRGISFQIGSLSCCTLNQMRKIERQLKNQKNAARYCTICNKMPQKFPECRQYPFEWNAKYLNMLDTDTAIIYTNTVCPEKLVKVSEEIRKAMSEEKEALGFVPAGENASEGIIELLKKNQVALAFSADDQLMGYAAYTINVWKRHAKIHQACVRDPFRGFGIGRNLVKMVALAPGIDKIVCTVRSDLAATEFWKAITFTVTGQRPHKTSGSTLVDFECSLDFSNGCLINTFEKEGV